MSKDSCLYWPTDMGWIVILAAQTPGPILRRYRKKLR